MKFARHIVALLAALLAPAIFGDQATSANYSMAISVEAGGERSTSQNYTHNAVVSPIAGRSVATLSDLIIFGFATRFNNPPVGVNDVRSHPQNAAIDITASSLLANDFEPEGDAISIIAVDATSPAGATVTLNGQTVNYSPPAGLTSADQFHYTLADSNGDIATATVTMAIAPPIANQPINTVSLVEQSDGRILVRFRAQPGSTEYIVQFTHDLNNPQWQVLQDVHAGADGIVELLIDPATDKQTFYRALVL